MLRVEMESDGLVPGERFLFWGGKSPAGWRWTPEEGIVELSFENLLDPLVEGMTLSAFDLTTPYVDWEEVEYDGGDRVGDSPVHWFRFLPAEGWKDERGSGDLSSVRVAIDARFDAPVRVEYLDSGDKIIRSLEVRSFKQIQETWIVRRLEGFDEETRDRSELRVDEAEVELALPLNLFLPESLSISAEQIQIEVVGS